MFENDRQRPKDAFPNERVGDSLELANAQVFHRSPPAHHCEQEVRTMLTGETASACLGSA